MLQSCKGTKNLHMQTVTCIGGTSIKIIFIKKLSFYHLVAILEVLASLKVFSLKRSLTGALRYLLGDWDEKIWREMCCFRNGTSGVKTIKATPSKQDLSTSYPVEVLFTIPDDNPHLFISRCPHPRHVCMGYWQSVRSRWLDIGQVLSLRFYGPRWCQSQ